MSLAVVVFEQPGSIIGTRTTLTVRPIS